MLEEKELEKKENVHLTWNGRPEAHTALALAGLLFPHLRAEMKKGEARAHFDAGGATAADWLLRLSASATKPEVFTSSTKARK